MNNLLEVEGLEKRFLLRGRRSEIHAVRGVEFRQRVGETLGVVGESGCGKSTLARLLMRLVAPTAGTIWFDGEDITTLPAQQMRRRRRHMQMVFQDPFASLDPRMTVRQLLEEPLIIHRAGSRPERRRRVAELLDMVGLPDEAGKRYPHEFSGGQRQRICIARAVALNPKLLICDEAVSALDVSVQSQILNLLVDLRRELGLTCLFISHDLAVIRYISDTVMVMYLGQVVEYGPVDNVFAQPRHPYTLALLDAIPVPDPRARRARQPLSGELPSPEQPPSGCPFHPRCSRATAVCREQTPILRCADEGPAQHAVACHLYPPVAAAAPLNVARA
jgi:oligopeptide/dipeptide ABC transporter ATP-binding protein